MCIVTKEQFEDPIKKHPNGGIVFNEEGSDDILVTDGSFGATSLAPVEGEVFDWTGILKNSAKMTHSSYTTTMTSCKWSRHSQKDFRSNCNGTRIFMIFDDAIKCGKRRLKL